MGIVKKVQFYKRTLQALFAINIAILTAGVIAGTSYFGCVQFMKVLTQQNTDRLQLLDSMQSDLFVLAEIAPAKKPNHRQIRHLEALRYKLESWPDTNFAQIAFPEDVEDVGLSDDLVSVMNQRIVTEKKKLSDQIVTAANELGSLARQLLILGISTLIFGIILPIVVFRRLTKEVAVARHQIESTVSHWIANWFETHAAHGANPWQDPSFWLKIILLSVETFAPQSRHPFMQFMSEFAPTLRKEIENERTLHQPKKSA